MRVYKILPVEIKVRDFNRLQTRGGKEAVVPHVVSHSNRGVLDPEPLRTSAEDLRRRIRGELTEEDTYARVGGEIQRDYSSITLRGTSPTSS